MTPQEIAQAILQLYSYDSSRWTQGAFARDAGGEPISATHKDSVCWCLMGASVKVASEYPQSRRAFYDTVNNVIPSIQRDQTSIYWNDCSDRTFQDVVDLLIRCAKV
jgi:hypothetical protein